jgi:putative ABC transport system permease protein
MRFDVSGSRLRAERLYARLFRLLLPVALESEYGADAVEMLRDRLGEERTKVRVAGVLARAIADLLIQSVAVRLPWNRGAGPTPEESMFSNDAGLAHDGRASAVRSGVPDLIAGLRSDAMQAIRQWRRAPGFAAAVLATLGLGIGISTAMFGVVNGVVLRPLPFPQPDRLVMVWERNNSRGWPRFTVSPANFFDWTQRATSFESMAAYTTGTATLTGTGEPTRLQVTEARWNLFAVLGVVPVPGRTFTEAEDEVGSDDVVVLSHRLWAGRFGSDPTILGRSIQLDGSPRRVVGVLPADFGFLPDTDAWVPLVFPFDVQAARGARYLNVIGRLGAGSTPVSAQSQVDGIADALAREYAEADAGWSAVVLPLRDQLLGGIDRTLFLLFAAVGLVMLIACVNVANLLLVRGTSRRDEFSMRKAMGAAPLRLARQVVIESIVTSAAGAVIGLVVAAGLTRALVAIDPGRLPRISSITIDARALVFCIGLSLIIGIGVGLLPAIQASRSDVTPGPGRGRSRTSGRGGRRVRNGLLVAEIAMAVMLMAGWGLVARSLYSLLSVDPGFQPSGLTVARLSPPASRYATPAARDAFFDAITMRLRELPVIERVGVTNRLPLTGSLRFGVTAEQEPVPPPADWASGELRAVDPDYFAAMRIRLLRGRSFARSDDAASPSVAILNEAMARMLLPEGDAIGSRILVASSDASCPCEVVGVVADVREAGLDQPAGPVYYLPQAQSVWTTRSLVIRSSAPMPAVVTALREAVATVDRDIAIFELQPLERVVAARLAAPRFNAVLLGTFAALALFLATIGIYGVTSHVVHQRRREMGVRSALGANATGLLWLVEREALLMAAIGITIGLAGAAVTTRFLKGMLFEVEPLDPAVILSTAVFLAGVCALSALVPAWRACRIDPVEALRLD